MVVGHRVAAMVGEAQEMELANMEDSWGKVGGEVTVASTHMRYAVDVARCPSFRTVERRADWLASDLSSSQKQAHQG